MRILADTNIEAHAVRSLRDSGNDVVYAAERAADPGDETLLADAVRENRVFLTKDYDIGALVYSDLRPHRGVLLVEALGAPSAEAGLIFAVVASHHALLVAGAFLRAGLGGVREAQASQLR